MSEGTVMNLMRLIAISVVLLGIEPTQETTISVPLSSEQLDEVTFDASRVSGTDVSRWIQLSAEGPFSQADIGTRLCFSQPPSENARKQQEIRRAQARLSKFRSRIRDLDQGHSRYLRTRSDFWTLGGSRRRLPVPEMYLRDGRPDRPSELQTGVMTRGGRCSRSWS